MKIASPLASSLAAAALLLLGCATPPVPQNALEARPSNYRHIQIAAITLDLQMKGGGPLEVDPQRRAEFLEATFRKRFRDKGYEVLSAHPKVRLNKRWTEHEAVLSALLDVMEDGSVHFSQETEDRRDPALTGPLPEITNFSSLDPKADAVAFLLTEGLIEPLQARKKRRVWNYTAGVVLTPVVYGLGGALTAATISGGGMAIPKHPPVKESPAWVNQCVLLLDAHSGEVIWGTGKTYLGDDPRSDGDLRSTVENVLDPLPDLPEGN